MIVWDIKTILNKAEILIKAANSGCNVTWRMSNMDFTIQSYLDITWDIILQN